MRARRVEENLFVGTAIKFEMRQTERDIGRSNPHASSSTTTVELRDVERADVDRARFEIPTNYRLRKQ